MSTYYTYSPGESYTVTSTTNYSGNIYGRYDRVGSYEGTGNTKTTIHKSGKLEAHPYTKTVQRYAFRAIYFKEKSSLLQSKAIPSQPERKKLRIPHKAPQLIPEECFDENGNFICDPEDYPDLLREDDEDDYGNQS